MVAHTGLRVGGECEIESEPHFGIVTLHDDRATLEIRTAENEVSLSMEIDLQTCKQM